MFAFESYLPFTAFNESSTTFKAAEVFRYGFLLADISNTEVYKQLYSYHDYYIEVTFNDNYEIIDHILAISVDEAIEKYVDHLAFGDAMIDLMN